MKRVTWEFEFTAKELLGAAQAKKKFHQERLAFWREAKDKVMAEIRESGLEIDESLAGSQMSGKSYRAPEVMIRNDLRTDLSEAHSKVMEHQDHVRDYDGWCVLFEAAGDKRLPCNADDYLYFFGYLSRSGGDSHGA